MYLRSFSFSFNADSRQLSKAHLISDVHGFAHHSFASFIYQHSKEFFLDSVCGPNYYLFHNFIFDNGDKHMEACSH